MKPTCWCMASLPHLGLVTPSSTRKSRHISRANVVTSCGVSERRYSHRSRRISRMRSAWKVSLPHLGGARRREGPMAAVAAMTGAPSPTAPTVARVPTGRKDLKISPSVSSPSAAACTAPWRSTSTAALPLPAPPPCTATLVPPTEVVVGAAAVPGTRRRSGRSLSRCAGSITSRGLPVPVMVARPVRRVPLPIPTSCSASRHQRVLTFSGMAASSSASASLMSCRHVAARTRRVKASLYTCASHRPPSRPHSSVAALHTYSISRCIGCPGLSSCPTTAPARPVAPAILVGHWNFDTKNLPRPWRTRCPLLRV
mmetsp:Transcript_12081/g.37266  ORF Transcript_12081/g.37266 Transcript_12081/m.37266 type:complete len:313 (-) Transcript_12081:2273-3211(-)